MFTSKGIRYSNLSFLFLLTGLILLPVSAVKSDSLEVTWESTLSTGFDSRFWSVDCTDDGGAVCVGESATEDEEITLLLLAKYSNQGLMQWKILTGWSLATTGQDVLQIPGGYVVCGNTSSGIDTDGFIAKFDSLGNVIWYTHIGNPGKDILYDVAQAADGCFVAAGYTESNDAAGKDALIVLVDPNGTLQWTRAFGTSGSDIAYSIVSLNNGGFALAGGSEGNFYIVITDEEGTVRCIRTYDHGGHEIARAIVESAEGGFFLAGSTMMENSYQADIWLVRTDFEANEIWTYSIERDGNDSAWDIVEPETGGYIILGNAMSPENGVYDAVLYEVDAWANIIREQFAGDSLWNTASSLSMTPERNLFLVGRTESAESGAFDSWIVYTSLEDIPNR